MTPKTPPSQTGYPTGPQQTRYPVGPASGKAGPKASADPSRKK